jgi:hypothetical protein
VERVREPWRPSPRRPARGPRATARPRPATCRIGPGAAAECLTKAPAAGAVRLRRKVAEAVAFAKLQGPGDVDEALAAAAAAGRFGEGDLAAIPAHRGAQVIEFPARACEQQSLQRSARSWEGFGG